MHDHLLQERLLAEPKQSNALSTAPAQLGQLLSERMYCFVACCPFTLTSTSYCKRTAGQLLCWWQPTELQMQGLLPMPMHITVGASREGKGRCRNQVVHKTSTKYPVKSVCIKPAISLHLVQAAYTAVSQPPPVKMLSFQPSSNSRLTGSQFQPWQQPDLLLQQQRTSTAHRTPGQCC